MFCDELFISYFICLIKSSSLSIRRLENSMWEILVLARLWALHELPVEGAADIHFADCRRVRLQQGVGVVQRDERRVPVRLGPALLVPGAVLLEKPSAGAAAIAASSPRAASVSRCWSRDPDDRGPADPLRLRALLHASAGHRGRARSSSCSPSCIFHAVLLIYFLISWVAEGGPITEIKTK